MPGEKELRALLEAMERMTPEERAAVFSFLRNTKFCEHCGWEVEGTCHCMNDE